MGGTTFLAGLVIDGAAGLDHKHRAEPAQLNVPMVDVHTIGAGGGAIAWLDAGRNLRVGPRSAGRPLRARPATGTAEPSPP